MKVSAVIPKLGKSPKQSFPGAGKNIKTYSYFCNTIYLEAYNKGTFTFDSVLASKLGMIASASGGFYFLKSSQLKCFLCRLKRLRVTGKYRVKTPILANIVQLLTLTDLRHQVWAFL